VDQRAALADFLRGWFSVAELRTMAFDLGAESEVFEHADRQDLAAALIRYLEEMGRLGCLDEEVRRRAPEAGPPPLPEGTPVGIRHSKVQVIATGSWESLRLDKLKRHLASRFKVAEGQVACVAAAGDQVRLLFSLPDTRPTSPIWDRAGGWGVVEPFESLSRRERVAWRTIACRWPPERQSNGLRPAVVWEGVQRAAARRRIWTLSILVVAVAALVAAIWIWIRPWLPMARVGIQAAWTILVREVVLWAQFLGSVAVSAIVLAWLTALCFALLALLLYLLPGWLDRLAARYPASARLPWARDGARALVKCRRLIGTLLNLLSSAAALGIYTLLLRQPLDGWDLGIQGVVTLLLELAILGLILRSSLASAAVP
jgi:hypothetical protein